MEPATLTAIAIATPKRSREVTESGRDAFKRM
jgi:hypothetical protein